MSRNFTCICSTKLTLPENQGDVKCAHCGRVYTYHGRFLWQESAGNDLPGSSEILPVGSGERRAEDEGDGIGEAFAAGKLPEVDARAHGSGNHLASPDRADAPPKQKKR